MINNRTLCLWVSVLTVKLSLTTRAEVPKPTAPEQDTAPKPDTLTFNKDIAPIVFQHCAGCHRPGQAAPFNLLTYEDFKKRAKQVAEVVEKRFMPPWLPERGDYEFADDRSLSAEQRDVIRRWVAEGSVEGAAKDLPLLPKWTEGWRLGTPDLVVKMPQPYALVAEGKDVYRNIVFPIPVSERKYVKAVEFLPGNAKVLHHAFITVDSTQLSRRRAEMENPPGFDGMVLTGTARMPGGQFLGWQPGKVPRLSLDGLGWTLEPNSDLVLQLHLHPSGKPELIQSTVALYFTEHPPTNTAFRINLNPLIIDIPAGAKDYTIADSYVLPIDVLLTGISPHTHYLGKRLEGSAILPDGTRKNLLLIKDWDFNWQGDYRYAQPVLLPKGTTLAMHFTYDNSAENERNPNHPPKRVQYGLQTTDEMGELWFQVLPRNATERNILGEDFSCHLSKTTIKYNEHLLMEDPNNAVAHTRAGRALHYLGQIPEALIHLQAAVKADPKYDRGFYELGFLYMRLNKLMEAQEAFENVVRLNPEDYEAHGNLGIIYLQQRNLDRAEAHFKAALRINPADDVARGYLDQLSKARAGSKPRQ